MEVPAVRKLRGYAFDPSLSNQLDTYIINEVTYKIPWEKLEYGNGTLRGEYLEIVDYDPTIDKFYEIIDLDSTFVLANNGFDPSESNPKFHQQMVYAVAMTTIKKLSHIIFFNPGIGNIKHLFLPFQKRKDVICILDY